MIRTFLFILGLCWMDSYGSNYDKSRREMVETLKKLGIRDPKILEIMGKVPRHEFVPDTVRELSYQNGPLPIGLGQTISQPFIVAYMTEFLGVDKSHRVLEIGTGSGYQAAVLAELAKEVYSIEIHENLCNQAKNTLNKLHYRNINIKCGDGYQGWPEKGPFQRIILTAAPKKIPKPLLDQLMPGGVLIAPVGEEEQELQKWIKRDGSVFQQKLIPVRFVPMTGRTQKE